MTGHLLPYLVAGQVSAKEPFEATAMSTLPRMKSTSARFLTPKPTASGKRRRARGSAPGTSSSAANSVAAAGHALARDAVDEAARALRDGSHARVRACSAR